MTKTAGSLLGVDLRPAMYHVGAYSTGTQHSEVHIHHKKSFMGNK